MVTERHLVAADQNSRTSDSCKIKVEILAEQRQKQQISRLNVENKKLNSATVR